MNLTEKLNGKEIPIGIFVQRFMEFNFEYLSTEEAVFFNYLVVKGQAFKFKEFFHSSETIYKETGIKRKSLDSIIKRFEELGIINVVKKGMPKVKYFQVNYERIVDLLPKIYRFDGHEKQIGEKYKLSEQRSKLIGQYYKVLAEKYKEKNYNKKLIKENLKDPFLESDAKEGEIFKNNLNKFLSEIKYKYNIHINRLIYEEEKILRAAQNYGEDILFKYIKNYLREEPIGSLKSFLKPDKFDSNKLEYIEKKIMNEKKFIENFLEKLNNLYNQRREMATNKGVKGFSATKITINNAIKKQISEALEKRSEVEIENAFIAYCDAVISGQEDVRKFMPFFLYKDYGEYTVIDKYLELFNLNYSYLR